MARPTRGADPFAALAPLLSSVRKSPLPPLLLVSGDDEWIVGEARRRVVAAFREAIREGEVSEYEGGTRDVAEAVADASTVALFSTNRLVTLEVSDLLRARKLTAEELDSLLDEVQEGAEAKVQEKLARKAHALLAAAGVERDPDVHELARRVCGRVKRAERAPELAALLAHPVEEGEGAESALDRLLGYAQRATAGDNALLAWAVAPDREHRGTRELRTRGLGADFSAADDDSRRERLLSVGLERALDRHVAVEPEVFETLTSRGRLTARAFLSELDRLIDSSPGGRVTAEAAARLILDERKEYGSDFVEAVAAKEAVRALGLLDRLLSGTTEFTAFRPFGKDEGPARKGPKGESAFFPLLGLLAGELRRMAAIKAALAERRSDDAGRGAPRLATRETAPPERRVDYRTFVDRVLPGLKAPRPGAAPLAVEGHPFLLHKAYLAAQGWTVSELIRALSGLAAIDRGVKSGAGSGRELLESFLLTLATPARARRR